MLWNTCKSLFNVKDFTAITFSGTSLSFCHNHFPHLCHWVCPQQVPLAAYLYTFKWLLNIPIVNCFFHNPIYKVFKFHFHIITFCCYIFIFVGQFLLSHFCKVICGFIPERPGGTPPHTPPSQESTYSVQVYWVRVAQRPVTNRLWKKGHDWSLSMWCKSSDMEGWLNSLYCAIMS